MSHMTVTYKGPWVVYALRDPESKLVKYVGVSSQFEARLHAHIRTNYTPCLDWVTELGGRGLSPITEILESGNGSGAVALLKEREHILRLKAEGVQLLNFRHFKDAPRMPEVTRLALLKANTGRHHSAATRARISASNQHKKRVNLGNGLYYYKRVE